MKKISMLLCLLVLMLFCANAYSADRYVYVGYTADKSDFYIDTQSIRYVNNNVIRYWDKEYVSVSGRKKIIADFNDPKLKKKLERLSEVKCCIDMDIVQNMARVIEAYYYDAKGHMIHSSKSFESWSNIPPSSIMEIERDAVIHLLGRNPRTPVYTPTPTPNQPPLRTPNDCEEYQRLQEYYQWLTHQPDYPEFDRWLSQKFVMLGITARDLNSYLMGYINGGGRYVEIQGMIASWYREFYQERYGGR